MGRCAGNVGAGEIGMDGVGMMGKLREKRCFLMQKDHFMMYEGLKVKGQPFFDWSPSYLAFHIPHAPRRNKKSVKESILPWILELVWISPWILV